MSIRHRSLLSIMLGMALSGVAGAGHAVLKNITGVPDLATLNSMPIPGRIKFGRRRGSAASDKRDARTRGNIRARSNKQRPAKLARKIKAAQARRSQRRA